MPYLRRLAAAAILGTCALTALEAMAQVCPNGYCPCPPTTILVDGICQCPEGTTFVDGQCQ